MAALELTTTICLIRHGETDWNASGKLQGQTDIELNDFGREQALQVSRYFKTEKWDILVSSPLKRAIKTAEIIASQINLPDIHIVDDIKERGYGAAEGLMHDERHRLFPKSIPGQEDFELLCRRAMNGITNIANDFSGKKIIVVSHGGLINSILYKLSSGEFGSFKTRLRNACINKISIKENCWKVEFYNRTVDELLEPAESEK
jgi:uncharacterized phosphatase